MFCPKCRAKFRPRIWWCSNCRHSLVIDPDTLTDEERQRYLKEEAMPWEDRDDQYRISVKTELKPIADSVEEEPVTQSPALPIGSFVLLIFAVIVAIFSLLKLSEFNTNIGQLAVAFSQDLANEKMLYQILVGCSVILGGISLGMIINYSLKSADQKSPEKVLVICPQCRQRSPENQIYCGHCGQKLS